MALRVLIAPAAAEGASAVFPLVREGVTLADAVARAEALLEDRAEEAVQRLGGGRMRRAAREMR